LRVYSIFKITLILIAVISNLQAQDIHFSQFYYSPATLNAGLTGHFDGSLRIADNYRIQWFTLPVPFISNSVSVDKNFMVKKNNAGLGLNVVNDKSGDVSLQVNKAYLNASYIINLKHGSFAAGIRPGYVIKTFNAHKLTFPDQYNPKSGGFDPSLPTAGKNVSDNLQYPDVSAGIYYFYQKFNKSFEIGLAGHHLFPAGESFLSSGFKLQQRYATFSSLAIELRNTNVVKPMLYYTWMAGASELIAGSQFLFTQGTNSTVQAVIVGAFVRSGVMRNVDAAILQGGLQMKNLLMSMSYDITVSGMNYANYYQGALELALIYIIHEKSAENIKVPCQDY